MQPIRECTVLTQYLLGKNPTSKTVDLFLQLKNSAFPALTIKETRIWEKCINMPELLPFVDAGLSWRKPNSAIRMRILQHLAILESVPEYHSLFLPKKRSPWFLFIIAGRGIAAIFKALTGSLLVRLL